MELRLFVAVAISLLILMVFQQSYAPLPPADETGALIEEEAPVRRTGEGPVKEIITGDTLTIETKSILAEVNSLGGGFSRLCIIDKDGEIINLVQADSSPYPLSLQGFGNWDLSCSGETLIATTSGEGYSLKRSFYFTDEKKLNIETLIRNEGTGEVAFDLATGWNGGLGTSPELEKDNLRDNRPFMQLNGRMRKKLSEGSYVGEIGMAGMLNRYFTVILLQPGDFINKADIRKASTKKSFGSASQQVFPEISLSGEVILGPGEEKLIEQEVYAGLKEYSYLKAIDKNLTDIFAFGFFGFLSKFFLNMLIFLNLIFGNHGVAIIILTLLLQIVMFPLNAKSFKSMNAMNAIQPKLLKLREKYESDPQRMNEEMLALYKKHNVSPLGGCLPMLLQFPIFISLLTMLRSSTELRYSSFLWISDLARADSLFAAIPGLSSIPIIGKGGPLPLLMGGAMFLQQRMMGATEGPQKTMAYMMPIIFTLMFMNFPAGLVLYWLSNSIFTFITQYSIRRKSG